MGLFSKVIAMGEEEQAAPKAAAEAPHVGLLGRALSAQKEHPEPAAPEAKKKVLTIRSYRLTKSRRSR